MCVCLFWESISDIHNDIFLQITYTCSISSSQFIYINSPHDTTIMKMATPVIRLSWKSVCNMQINKCHQLQHWWLGHNQQAYHSHFLSPSSSSAPKMITWWSKQTPSSFMAYYYKVDNPFPKEFMSFITKCFNNQFPLNLTCFWII